jgi:hypothetical protein
MMVVYQEEPTIKSTRPRFAGGDYLVSLEGSIMRQLITIIAILTFLCPTLARGECFDAVSNGDDAYTYARKAYRESSFEEAQNYARKAKNAADDAKSAADDCNCDEAESEFDDAYTYARRAYNSGNLSELRDYARRAMHAAEAGKEAAENCR